MKFRVFTPVPGFSGTSAGVVFDRGVAVVEEGTALRYFRSAGYVIEEIEPDEQAKQADDEAEPATEVVAAGTPTMVQSVTEPALLEPVEPVADEPVKPAGNASTEEWRAYAIAVGLDPAEVAEMSRNEIKAKFTDDKESENPQ